MSNLAYRYKAELTFNGPSGETAIDPLYIRYLMIENLYIERQMPIVYLSISLEPSLYEVVVKSENLATFFLSITCYNAYSQSSVEDASFSGIFNYAISTNNPSYNTPLSEGSNSIDGNFRAVTVALINADTLNATRSEKDINNGILVSGVFKEIDTDTLIGKVVEGFEKYNLTSIIKAPDHNNEFSELVVPPMNNRTQILQFIFDKAPFYNTRFTFFIDFHNAYLLDQDKEGCMVNDSSGIDTIIFDVNDVTQSQSYDEGMHISGGACTVYLNPSHVNIYPNKVQDKIANNLITVDEYGNLDAKPLNVNNNTNSDPKYTFKRGGNAQLYKNILESNLVQLIITKEGLDTSKFTPNKKYEFNNHQVEDYNGSYLLIEKRDVIRSNNGIMRISTEFVLRKIGDIEDIGDTNVNSRNSKSNGNLNSRDANTKSPTNNSAKGTGGSKKGSQPTNSAVSTKKLRKVPTIPPIHDHVSRKESTTGGIDFLPEYTGEISIVEQPVMKASYGASNKEITGDQVQELTPEEWAARTSLRGNGSIIDTRNAGPNKIILARGGQSLNKTLFSD